MIARIIHTSLNARGGSERLAVATIKALHSAGFDVELDTFDRPDFGLIKKAYSEDIAHMVKKFGTLNVMHPERAPARSCDITVNTHGDMLPFSRPGFSSKNAITYCHYPLAPYLMDCSNSEYADTIQNLALASMTQSCKARYMETFRQCCEKAVSSSTVLTNSEYSRRAIRRTFGVDARVLCPPVDVEAFRNSSFCSGSRDDTILVIARFHPSKKIENAILLASLLKKAGVGRQMKIVGNVSPPGYGYYSRLRQLARRLELLEEGGTGKGGGEGEREGGNGRGYVSFELNASFGRLLELMRTCKVYLHPLPGEPFGMSTVEAMSAGMVPVVPDIGGHTEFVPPRFQFHTFRQGAEAIARALEATSSERLGFVRSAEKYSVPNYVKQFQQIVAGILEGEGEIGGEVGVGVEGGEDAGESAGVAVPAAPSNSGRPRRPQSFS